MGAFCHILENHPEIAVENAFVNGLDTSKLGEQTVILDYKHFRTVFNVNVVMGDAPVISGAVAECIEASAEGVRPGEALTLKIKSGCIDEAEKARYRAAVKTYYTGKYIAAGRELSRNRTVSLLLAAAGVLVLALALIFEQRIAPVWAEVLDIVAWVFLWEATDIWFLSSAKLRRERRRCISLVAMQVDFEALDEKK
jgi:hypothetical protein